MHVLIIQYFCILIDQCIKITEASFAEAFYGIRRFALGKPGGQLPLRERRLSLMLIVILDYSSQKLQSLVDQWKSEYQPPGSLKV
jgi:hypothetical protein